MNDQITPAPSAIMNGAPEWLTLPFVLIGLGVLFALYILWRGTLLAKRRGRARAELEERGEVHYGEDAAPAPIVTAPPVAPSPPPLADAPTPETMPIAATLVPEPDAAPEPAPIADEPIAAAAPLNAAPATLAASDLAPAPEAQGDDLTQLKGVGPRLADRLNAVGVTSFAQIAALSPDEAAALDAKLGDFQGRLHRDRWIEQAGFLASGDVAGYEAVFGKL